MRLLGGPNGSGAISLAGDWDFQLDPPGEFTVGSIRPDRRIRVPLPWQAAFPELCDYGGYAWYQRSFTVDKSVLEGEALLRFGAVDYWCQVFINGTPVGTHEGGYTPFAFGIRGQLRVGENTITVRVYDPVQRAILAERWPDYGAQMVAAANGPPFDAQHIPHGKQEVYLNVGGIWQDVTLTPVPRTWIRLVHVTPDLDRSTARVEVRLSGQLAAIAGTTLALSVNDGRRCVATGEVPLSDGADGYGALLTLTKPRRWSVEDPFLYELVASLDTPTGRAVHTTRFGMRSFTARDGHFFLNGDPIYLLSALDQDLYPETIYTVPSEAFLRDEFAKAKQLGLNSLRCHIKPPDPLYLDLADEMGLLIWAEVPSWRTFWPKGTLHPHQLDLPPELKRRVERTLEDMVERDFNHPSLVIWTLINEDWGTSLAFSAADRQWLADLYDHCKDLDPTRLVVDNSACAAPWGPNFHVKSDIDDFHLYASIPDQAEAFVGAVEELALRPLWTFSTYGDGQRGGDEPLVLSEFGNWGLPSLSAGSGGVGEPAWFSVRPWGAGWDVEPGYPSGSESRFSEYGLQAIWGDYAAFTRETQRHQGEALKLEIEAVRRQGALAGYVVTQLTDAYWESNGLLDFTRSPKVFHDSFRLFNTADVVIPSPDSRAYWSGSQAQIDLVLSAYSDRASHGGTLVWQLDRVAGAAQSAIPGVTQGSTSRLGTLRPTLPEVTSPEVIRIRFEVCEPDGGVMAENFLDLAVYPRTARQPATVGPVALINRRCEGRARPQLGQQKAMPTGGGVELHTEPQEPETDVLEYAVDLDRERPLSGRQLRELGYEVRGKLGADVAVAISSSPTSDLLAWVRRGGDLLFLSEGQSPFYWVHARAGSYGGGWITSYSWIRPEVHRRIYHANPIGLAFVEVMPQYAILGLPMADRGIQADVLAGMVVGWVHHPAAHTIQFRYGRGRVVMTTFRLARAIGNDPTAAGMLHDLLDHLASDRCDPSLKANY